MAKPASEAKLKAENTQLKKLLAETMLDNAKLQEALSEK